MLGACCLHPTAPGSTLPLAPCILSSHLTLLHLLEESSDLLAEPVVLSFVFSSFLHCSWHCQLCPPLNSPPLVSVMVHGPFFFSLLGNLVSFYFVSSCVFSLIVSFLGGLCLPSALHLHPISLDKHIHFYDFHWWYISRPDFSFLLSLIFLAAC